MVKQRDVTRIDGACAAVRRRGTLTSARADRTEPPTGEAADGRQVHKAKGQSCDWVC